MTPEALRARLALIGAGAPVASTAGDSTGDKVFAGGKRIDADRATAPDTLISRDHSIVPAAVLVAVVMGEHPSVLLTKRTTHLKKHAGQISFPGGRIDPEDPSPEAAALREAWEEIGLPPSSVDVLGRLNDQVTGTGYRITPVLAALPPALRYEISPHEVEAIFELPMSIVLDPAAPRRQRQQVGGVWRDYWVWPHPDHFIWGATAAILVQLARRLRGDDA